MSITENDISKIEELIHVANVRAWTEHELLQIFRQLPKLVAAARENAQLHSICDKLNEIASKALKGGDANQ